MSEHPSPALFDQFARGWRGYLLIALIALVSSQFGASQLPVIDRDEARFAQATRQMVETGDYVRIRLQEVDRNKKPIGIHWLQAASVRAFEPLTHRLNDIWPYRLPSALGAILAALATMWAGSALFPQRTAFIGAALFAAGILIGAESTIAKTDAMLAGCTTLAMAALAHLYAHNRRPRLTALVFWLAVGCGVLIKGPVTPLVAGLALAAIGLWEKRWAWMKPLMWWPGPLLATLIVAPWMIAIGVATHGQFFAEAVGGDLAPKLVSGQEGHFGWPGYHTLLLAIMIFPATYALPAAGRLAWEAIRAPRNDAESASLRFLVAWAAPTFLLFELLPTKLPHYTLPAYPAIALLCGAGLMAMLRRPWRTPHPVGIAVFAVAGAVLVAVMAASATFMPGDAAADLRRAISAGLIGASALIAAIVALVFLRRPAARAGVIIACALTLSFSLRDRLLPEARELFVSTEVVTAMARERLAPRENHALWAVGYGEPSLVFLTRTALRIADPAGADAGVQPGDTMIVEGRVLQETEAALAARDLTFAIAGEPVRGIAIGRGKRVALFLGRAEILNAVAADAPPQNP